jgi:N-acetylneuraminate synthase
MIIDRNIQRCIIFSEDSILNALKKMSDNRIRIIFALNESGVLEGLATDGDLRRWLVSQSTIDLNQPISRATNKSFTFAYATDSPSKIESCFSRQIEFVPVLDTNRRLTAVASKGPGGGLHIGKFLIEDHAPSLLIAEIGINHNGSLALAKQLVDEAVAAGADCAKFQMRNLRSLYRNAGNAYDAREDLGAQYTLDLLSRFQLTIEEMTEAFDHCRARGILPLCTPWDLESLATLDEYGMDAFKIASADLTNHELLAAAAKTGKPLILSTGMSTEAEIVEAVDLLQKLGTSYALLQCNSTYPAPFKDVHLNYLDRLKEIGGCPVGYSGHERGYCVPIAAVGKGARIIEKHFSLDKTMEGNDHKVSLTPGEFRAMVQAIREVEQALGSGAERRINQGEMMNRVTLAKSLVINRDLAAGLVITADMIEIKGPGRGVQPNKRRELIGRRAKRSFLAGDFFFPSDLVDEQVQPRNYKFRRRWGVPVRYHDFRTLVGKTNLDFLEFHMSYKDLDADFGPYFTEPYDLDLVVHSPDLFAGDHLLNLCAQDEKYRQRSIRELQRVVNITRALKPFFLKARRPLIVVSPGGFTKNAHLHRSERPAWYELTAKSLAEIDQDGVEIILQTLPPFPWYFGGQLYLNLFVDAEDTAEFCRKYGYRLCLDVSHTKLACNFTHASFKETIEAIGPYTAHLHLGDASGVDGEGLQIGEGDIDFPALAEHLEKNAPEATFIPEIWQGHKNDGEGFWIAAERLDGLF